MLDFLGITLIIVLATISPGPDFTLVSRNSLRYSQKTGMMTALGITCGTAFHSLYCILGFAIIISKSLLLFNIIKYVGAAYLVYLGIKGLREIQASPDDETSASVTMLTHFEAFRQGLFCTSLNPKAILFFIAFFTIIIKPTMSFLTQTLYAVEIAIIDLLWFAVISYFFSHPKVKAFLGKCLHYITKIFGGFLVVFGIKIASMSK